VEKIEGADKLIKVLSLAALITVTDGLDMAAAVEEAVKKASEEGVTAPLNFANSLANIMDAYHGRMGGWMAYTGVPNGEETDPGIFFDGKKIKWKWRRNATDGADEKGHFTDRDSAWKAAAKDCRNRIDSGDL
jgi:hypothetical protein